MMASYEAEGAAQPDFSPSGGTLTAARSRAFAIQATDGLLRVFSVAPVDHDVLRRALALDWPDFEDAVCAASAEACECEGIVSRDPRGFPRSPVQVIDPATALAWLAGE